jgi:hypothetical protein
VVQKGFLSKITLMDFPPVTGAERVCTSSADRKESYKVHLLLCLESFDPIKTGSFEIGVSVSLFWRPGVRIMCHIAFTFRFNDACRPIRNPNDLVILDERRNLTSHSLSDAGKTCVNEVIGSIEKQISLN